MIHFDYFFDSLFSEIDSLLLVINGVASTGSNYFASYMGNRNGVVYDSESTSNIISVAIAGATSESTFARGDITCEFYSDSDDFAILKCYSAFYRNQNEFQSALTDFVFESNTAITSVTLTPSAGTNFKQGSKFELYLL